MINYFNLTFSMHTVSDMSPTFGKHVTLTQKLTLRNFNQACISNHMHSKMGDEITYPFPNFNSCAVEVLQWVSNFIPQFIMDAITYPSCD